MPKEPQREDSSSSPPRSSNPLPYLCRIIYECFEYLTLKQRNRLFNELWKFVIQAIIHATHDLNNELLLIIQVMAWLPN